jgi:hypothetical protein
MLCGFLEKDVVLAEKLMRYKMQKTRDPAQEEKKDSSEKRNENWKEKQSDEQTRDARIHICVIFADFGLRKGNVKLSQG